MCKNSLTVNNGKNGVMGPSIRALMLLIVDLWINLSLSVFSVPDAVTDLSRANSVCNLRATGNKKRLTRRIGERDGGVVVRAKA